MAPRSAAAGLLACVCALLLLALSPSTFVVAVPRLDAFVGDDLDAPRRPPSAASADAATSDAAAAVAAAAIESRTPLDDLTAYWLENADELAARDARLSPEDRALELARRETEWRNAAKRKEQAERMEKGEEEEGGKKSLREMERERKRFKEEKSKDSSTEEGSLDPNANDSNVIDAATLYSPPKATAFKAQGDAPAKISLGKMLTEGYDPKAGGRGLAPGAARAEEDLPRMVLNTFDLMEEGDEEDRPKYRASAPAPPPPPNAYGARPNDVPVVSPTPIDLSVAVRAKTPIEASRLVLNDSGAPVWGFAAVSSADQPLRRYRPPDQGLCSGNGIVIAGNNLVYRAFNATDGSVLQGPIAPQDFYGMGGDMSDPVCVYDGADTKRFYLGMFQWGGGSGGKYSRFMVAVSRSSNPVRDGWDGPFLVRNDGLDQKGKSLPGLESCGRSGGCMGDYPTIGMDKNSLWVGFNLFGSGYDGVLVLAISKRSLVEARRREPAAVAYSGWPGDLAFTVHPTTTQASSQSSPGPAPGSGGAVFLVSTGPATQNDPSRNEVALWAATDTAAFDVDDFPSELPSGELRLPKISAPANVPVPAYRDTGAFRGARLALDQPSPGIPLDGGDGRTAQAVFSGGLIWCAAQTAMHIATAGSPLVIGVVYWAFEPLWNPVDASNPSRGYSFVPKLAATGYVGAGLDTALTGKPGKTHVGRPAITASAKGTAWIGGILTGLGTNPTAVAVEVDLFEGPRAMHVGAIAPAVIFPLTPDEKGSPGYLRGGDYSAAALGDDGETAWMSSQWSGGTGAKQCYSKFDAVLGGQGASSCPSWGTWVSRARVEVGGASAVERVAAKKKGTGSGSGGGAAVGPAGAPSPSSSPVAPSPSEAPASSESYAESWMVIAMEAAAPVNRPSVEEKEEDGKEREVEEEKENEKKEERD